MLLQYLVMARKCNRATSASLDRLLISSGIESILWVEGIRSVQSQCFAFPRRLCTQHGSVWHKHGQ